MILRSGASARLVPVFWLDLVLCFALKLRVVLVRLKAVHVVARCSACLDAFYAVKHESLWDLQRFLRLICVLRLLEVLVWDSLADRRLICSSGFGLVFLPAAIRVFFVCTRCRRDGFCLCDLDALSESAVLWTRYLYGTICFLIFRRLQLLGNLGIRFRLRNADALLSFPAVSSLIWARKTVIFFVFFYFAVWGFCNRGGWRH
jgi:hypothetical protein